MAKRKRKLKECRGPNLARWETQMPRGGYLVHRRCGGRLGHPLRKTLPSVKELNSNDARIAVGRPRCVDCGVILGRKAFREVIQDMQKAASVPASVRQRVETYYEDGKTQRLWAFYRHHKPPLAELEEDDLPDDAPEEACDSSLPSLPTDETLDILSNIEPPSGEYIGDIGVVKKLYKAYYDVKEHEQRRIQAKQGRVLERYDKLKKMYAGGEEPMKKPKRKVEYGPETT